MRAMHLYKDISPPCSEVFRASAYVMQKVERKRISRLRSEPGGYRRKKELGGRRKPEGEGGEGEAAGGACV